MNLNARVTRRIFAVFAAVLMFVTSAGVGFAAQSLARPGEEVEEELQQEKKEPKIENNTLTEPAKKEEVKFTIKKIRLDAEELDLDKEDLAEILEDTVDRELTLKELNETVAKVTAYSRKHGYPASAAYLPAQTSTDGTVVIKLIPGKYGQVKLDNQSKLKDSIARSFTDGLKPDTPVKSGKLQTTLYSLSDLSGTKAVGVLSPGKEFGTSDLTVRIEDGKESNTVVYAENYGSKNSGRYRYGLQHSVYDLGGTGGKLNVGTLISNNHLRNYYINYETLVGRGGTTLGLGFSRMDYKLGGVLRQWGANGTANTVSVFGSRPIFHHTDKKLRFTYGYNYRDLRDDLDFLGGLGKGKKHSHGFHAGLDGYLRGKGQSLDWAVNVTTGTVGMDSYYTEQLNTLNHTEGRFTKAEFNLTGVQSLGHETDFVLKLSGQKASHNLDGSEEIYLGGANAIRAYPQGEGSGDEGVLGTAELRWHTPFLRGLTLSTYFDAGHVKISKSFGESETLKGWGISASYTEPNNWFARIDYARRIGDHALLTDAAQARGRVWFILGKIW